MVISKLNQKYIIFFPYFIDEVSELFVETWFEKNRESYKNYIATVGIDAHYFKCFQSPILTCKKW